MITNGRQSVQVVRPTASWWPGHLPTNGYTYRKSLCGQTIAKDPYLQASFPINHGGRQTQRASTLLPETCRFMSGFGISGESKTTTRGVGRGTLKRHMCTTHGQFGNVKHRETESGLDRSEVRVAGSTRQDVSPSFLPAMTRQEPQLGH